MPEVISRN